MFQNLFKIKNGFSISLEIILYVATQLKEVR